MRRLRLHWSEFEPLNFVSVVSTMTLRFVALISLAAVAMISGCSYNTVLDMETVGREFPFLRQGQTKREEVRARLGSPVASYELDRILVYSMIESSSSTGFEIGYARGYATPLYHLVLVFGSDGALERHGLVRVQ